MNTNRELNYRMYLHREENFVRTDIVSEFSRYDDIKNGNVDKVRSNFETIRKNFYQGKGTLSDNPVRNNIYHLVVSAGIIARVCVDAGLPHDEAYTLSDIYIRRADVAKTPEEVIELIGEMQLDFASRMQSVKSSGKLSVHIRHAINYIYNHLNEPITVAELADNVGLNVTYFSKLFAYEVGMPAKAFIRKIKTETAANMLEDTSNSLSDIAVSFNFSSQSAFCAAFKKQFGITPTEYRNTHQLTGSKQSH